MTYVGTDPYLVVTKDGDRYLRLSYDEAHMFRAVKGTKVYSAKQVARHVQRTFRLQERAHETYAWLDHGPQWAKTWPVDAAALDEARERFHRAEALWALWCERERLLHTAVREEYA